MRRPIQSHDSITDELLTDKQERNLLIDLRVDNASQLIRVTSVLVYPSGVRE